MSNFVVKIYRLEDLPDFLVSCRKILSAEVGIPLDSPYNQMNPGNDSTSIVGTYCLFFVMFDGDTPVSMSEAFLYKQKYSSYQSCSIQDMLTRHSTPSVDLSWYCGMQTMAHLRSLTIIEEYRSKMVVFPGTLYAAITTLNFLGMTHITALSRYSLLNMYQRVGFEVASKVDVAAAMKITANDASFMTLSIKDWIQGKLCAYVKNRMNFIFKMDEEIAQEIASRKSLL